MHDPLTYRYKRTLIDAFGCDATQAVAIHKYKPPMHRRFFYALIRTGWAVGVVALAAVVLTGCSGDMRHEQAQAKELQAIQQEQEAQASRDFVARQVCGEARAQWISDKTLYCEPRRGKAYKASVQLP
jgi:hypothetical protein